MQQRKSLVYTCILLFVLLSGCGDKQTPLRADVNAVPYIVVVNNPLLYFTQRLIANEIDVRLLVPPGVDPAAWQPTALDVLQLQGAELLLLNGAGYSSWLDKVSISPRKIVITSENAKNRWLELPGQVTHSHGPGTEHAHGDYAITTWMDMSLAGKQAQAIADALQKRWPRLADAVAVRLQDLITDIDALDQGYQAQARRLAHRDIIYSHPVYQYFERRYQLPGHSLHWEPDVMPSDEQWIELQAILSASSLFIWEGDPDTAISVRMAAQALAFAVVDPAANTSAEDWLSIQQGNLTRLSNVGL
jgi:zinc transport system substrate-binding protein